ncbi:helix-turn-helix domain-containing protein [Kitasatospora sp. NPDC085879]|uniref:helix-turn-helix domain-containing protein n=1 Tax=Kitasatospora sp. NPDC085879 TaxID=3154769 RepID=UPI003415F0CF
MPEDRRAQAVRSLVEPGQRRRVLAAELEQVEAELRPMVLEAVAAGVTYRRIAELSGISRATVARWNKTE